MPSIVQFFVDSSGYHHDVDVWYLKGDYLLALMIFCVHLPLGKFFRFQVSELNFRKYRKISRLLFVVLRNWPFHILSVLLIAYRVSKILTELFFRTFQANWFSRIYVFYWYVMYVDFCHYGHQETTPSCCWLWKFELYSSLSQGSGFDFLLNF